MEDENHKKQIEEAIALVLREDFLSVRVDHIEITESFFGAEDDSDISISVFFTGEPKSVGAFSQVVRKIMPHFKKIKEERFPIFSFIKGSETKSIAAH